MIKKKNSNNLIDLTFCIKIFEKNKIHIFFYNKIILIIDLKIWNENKTKELRKIQILDNARTFWNETILKEIEKNKNLLLKY